MKPSRRPVRPRFRPTVVQLEDRLVPANLAPTMDNIPDQNLAEDASRQTVTITGITPGAGEVQGLNIDIQPDASGILTNLTLGQFQAQPDGSFHIDVSYSLVRDANGTAGVTVTLRDNGGTADGGVDTTVQQFNVNVAPLNDAPSANPLTVTLSGNAQIQLSGQDGDFNQQQALTFAVTKQPDHGFLSNFNSATGAVTYTPATGYTGPDNFAFTVTDDGTAGPVANLTSPAATVSLNVFALPTTFSSFSGATLKAFSLQPNKRRPQASKLRLTFAGAVNIQPGAFVVSFGKLKLIVTAVVRPSGGDTEVELSLGVPRGKTLPNAKSFTLRTNGNLIQLPNGTLFDADRNGVPGGISTTVIPLALRLPNLLP